MRPCTGRLLLPLGAACAARPPAGTPEPAGAGPAVGETDVEPLESAESTCARIRPSIRREAPTGHASATSQTIFT
jgi:hypothetical protein